MAGPGQLARRVRVALLRMAPNDDPGTRLIIGCLGRFVRLYPLYYYLVLLRGKMCDCNVTNWQRISNSMIASVASATSILRWEGVHSTEPSEERPPGWM